MYTQLLVKHFENSVPNVIRLPVPRHLRGALAAILILRNPKYPRHFLNGCYLILRGDQENFDSSLSLQDSLLSLIRCSEDRWRELNAWRIPLFSRHSSLVANSKILGWPCEPNITNLPTLLTEGPSLIMSMKPNFSQKTLAGLQCYITQLSSNSWIVDGGDYFRAEYPAKSSLVDHENTLAWVFAGTPVGYIQYISLENEKGESQILITGLAVEESYHRRGFARGLILAIVCRTRLCKEIWISVRAENIPAFSLYSKCGFLVRRRCWDLSMKTVISTI